jgi:hypothetical protein
MVKHEFEADIKDGTIILPREDWARRDVRLVTVVVMIPEERRSGPEARFSALKLRTRGFRFDREAANER